MKIAMILGAMAAGVWMGAMSNGFAAGNEDILVAGKTAFDEVRYDPKINLLTIAGGSGDDRIEVALAEDGGVTINGISLAKLGIPVEGVPAVVVYGGAGNDMLVCHRLPLAVMNGGDGKDVLVWDNGDHKFDRATYGEDVLLWNSPETEFAYGSAGLDILIANTGADRDAVLGHLGRDLLLGGSGADTLDDDLIGEWGDGWISGGTGEDEK